MHYGIVACVAMGAASACLGQNLLLNGGFEELDGFGFPSSWNEYPGSALGTEAARTGVYSMRVVPVSSLQPGTTQAENTNPNAAPPIPASAGVEYELSGYALHRSTDSLAGSGHQVGIQMFFQGASLSSTGGVKEVIFDGTTDDVIPGEDEWHYRSVSMVAPVGTVGVGVGLFIVTDDGNRLNGSGYFDDVELRVVGGSAADLNADGSVGSADLATLLAGWGVCPLSGPTGCATDLDGDGATGAGDLAVLLAAWTG